jgi:hypothetical protein
MRRRVLPEIASTGWDEIVQSFDRAGAVRDRRMARVMPCPYGPLVARENPRLLAERDNFKRPVSLVTVRAASEFVRPRVVLG